MKRSAPLRRHAWMAGINRKRRAQLFARNFGERAAAVRSMPCLACRVVSSVQTPVQFSPTQAAHARARGMGGAKGGRRDLVPLCAQHHFEAGEARTSQRAEFERRHGLDLQAEATRVAEQLDREGYP